MSYPDNVTQAMIESYFGRPLSDVAEEELDRQCRIQDAIAVLRNLLDAEEGEQAMETKIDYGPLQGALHDATISRAKLLDIITDADEERRRCAMTDASEKRAELRREYQA